MARTRLSNISVRADGSTFVRTTITIPTKDVQYVQKESMKNANAIGTSKLGISGFIVWLIEYAKKNKIFYTAGR